MEIKQVWFACLQNNVLVLEQDQKQVLPRFVRQGELAFNVTVMLSWFCVSKYRVTAID